MSHESIIHLNTENFAEEVEKSELPVLVDFWAEWCGPCRMMTPVIEEFAGKNAGEVSVVKIDIDASPAVTQKFQVTSIPTLILFRDGEPIGTFVGLKDLSQLEQLVNESLAAHQ